MPVVYTGQFACVYKVTAESRDLAVRCFTREVKDQQVRYGRLDNFLTAVLPEAFVGFQYMEEGIRVKGQWYPIVKMDWAEGEPLNRFVEHNLGNPGNLMQLAARWRGVIGSLQGLRIAHNDLQHGNVMVQAGRIRLVDYDGIFLPDFLGEHSPEIGHKNYQHPQRTSRNYNAHIDNFPALVVYLSLLALNVEPALWDQFYNDDNLLLTQQDYANPKESRCLWELKRNKDETVRKLACQLERYCTLPVEEVPDLESILRGDSAPSSPPVTNQEPLSNTYRRLLQGQPQSPVSPPPNTLIKCPKCGRNNDRGLIYCIHQDCIAALSTVVKVCPCRASIPANARFCTECGLSQYQENQPAGRATARQPSTPQRPATSARSPAQKTCPNCRQLLPGSAIYCNRCGTVLI